MRYLSFATIEHAVRKYASAPEHIDKAALSVKVKAT